MVPVDVIFLDIDGVLLPFGAAKKSSEEENHKCDYLFPHNTMHALTHLLQKVKDILLTIEDCNNNKRIVKGNPVLVLSSTWRAQQQFITDILESFKGYVAFTEKQSVHQTWKPHLDAFFDLVDPTYHSTRHDEIFSWIRDNERGKNMSRNNLKKRKRRTPQELECSATVINFQVRSWIALDDEDLVHIEKGRVEEKAIGHAVKTESTVGLSLQEAERGYYLLKNQINAFYQLA